MADGKSDPPLVKISKFHNSLIQNLGFCAILTIAYLTAPLIGKNDFSTTAYLVLMAASIGLINLPKTFGKDPGTIGNFTMLGTGTKLLFSILMAKINA